MLCLLVVTLPLSPPAGVLSSVQGERSASVLLRDDAEAGGGGGSGGSGENVGSELVSRLRQTRSEQAAAAGKTPCRVPGSEAPQQLAAASSHLSVRVWFGVFFQLETELSDSQSQLQTVRSEVSVLQRDVKGVRSECALLR